MEGVSLQLNALLLKLDNAIYAVTVKFIVLGISKLFLQLLLLESPIVHQTVKMIENGKPGGECIGE